MVGLVEMTQQEFDAFLEHDIRLYAQERVRAGSWSETEALARSRREHRLLLRDGIKTRYHHFFTIRVADSAEPVGIMWFMTDMDSSRGSAFIYDVEIHEPYRGKGFARQAMLELERIARDMGIRQLGLHVFQHNEKARALYESLGFRVASLNLLKDI